MKKSLTHSVFTGIFVFIIFSLCGLIQFWPAFFGLTKTKDIRPAVVGTYVVQSRGLTVSSVKFDNDAYIYTTCRLLPQTENMWNGHNTWVYDVQKKHKLLAKKLFSIDGVNSLLFYPYRLKVEKANHIYWKDIIPEITRILDEFALDGNK